MKYNTNLSVSDIKRKILLNGLKETVIDGEKQYLMDMNNVLLIGLEIIADKKDGSDAIKNLELTRTLLEQYAKDNKEYYLQLLDINDSNDLVHKILFTEDITEQLICMVKYAYLTSDKVLKVRSEDRNTELQELRSKIQQLEVENNKLQNINKGEVNRKNIEIEQLKKQCKVLDKENRKLEHQLQDIQKKLDK